MPVSPRTGARARRVVTGGTPVQLANPVTPYPGQEPPTEGEISPAFYSLVHAWWAMSVELDKFRAALAQEEPAAGLSAEAGQILNTGWSELTKGRVPEEIKAMYSGMVSFVHELSRVKDAATNLEDFIAVPFMTDVTDPDGTPTVNYESGTVPSDKVVSSVEYQSGELTLTIHGEVDGGPDDFTPTVTIEGTNVSGSPVAVSLSALGTDTRRYSFSQAITLTGAGTVSVKTADGGIHSVPFSQAAAPPSITVLTIGNPPGSQTRVKNGDSVNFHCEWDATGADTIVIEAWGLSGGGTQEFAVSELVTSYDGSFTVSGADSTNSTDPHKIRAHMKLPSEATGSTQEQTAGSGHYHDSNAPTLANISVSNYPASQTALKDSESCDCTATLSGAQGDNGLNTDWSSILYSENGTGELTIPATGTYAATKSVSRASGDYRESGNNYKIVVSKTYNDTSTTKYACVKIAHATPVVTVNTVTPSGTGRLRTDDGTNNYADRYIYLSANQVIGATPDNTNGLVAPKGTWQGSWSSYDSTTYRRYLRIADGDIVSGGTGANQYSWTSCEVKNRALRTATVVTTNTTYDIGGFEARTLTIPAWPNREADIGCLAVDTSKLTCENLSKGGGGPNGGTVFTFDNSPGEGSTPDDEVDKFCISNGSDIVDDDGQYWYNKDQANAVSNTSGTAQTIVEEEA